MFRADARDSMRYFVTVGATKYQPENLITVPSMNIVTAHTHHVYHS